MVSTPFYTTDTPPNNCDTDSCWKQVCVYVLTYFVTKAVFGRKRKTSFCVAKYSTHYLMMSANLKYFLFYNKNQTWSDLGSHAL